MENTAPFFSIVMPVYNVEKHLNKAVDSVLAQSFTDFELILVDDCSSDDCPKICASYAARDTRIKFMPLPENSGASHARSAGLSISNGQYILFMDSDDTISDELFQNVYTAACSDAPDVVMYSAEEIYEDAKGSVYDHLEVRYPAKVLRTKQEVVDEVIHIEKTTLFGYLWNKFYSKALLKKAKVSFSDMPLNEDFQFNIDLFPAVSSLTVLDYVGYQYYKRDGQSLTSKFVPNYFDLQISRIESLYNFYLQFGDCSDTVKTVLCGIYVRSLFSALQRNFDPRANFNGKERKLWLQQQFNSSLYAQLMPFSAPEGAVLKVLNIFLAHKSIYGTLFIARCIYFIKTEFPNMFSKLKQNR